MNYPIKSPLIWLLPTLFAFSACEVEAPIDLLPQQETDAVVVAHRAGEIIPGAYIVQYKQDLAEFTEVASPRSERPALPQQNLRQAPKIGVALTYRLMSEHALPESRVERIYTMPGSKGFSLKATEQEIAELKNDSRIASIEPDRIIAMGLISNGKGRLIPADDGPSTQMASYGLERIGGSTDMSKSKKFAWIVDSGIDLDHEDLNVKTGWAMDYTEGPWNVDDEFGHGTHVAGIIGAMDNDIGMVGVAAGVQLIPVKVLDAQGVGTTSSLIDAINYIGWYSKSGDVVNLSVSSDRSTILDQAVIALKNNYEVQIVVAAGNASKSTSTSSPTNLDESDVYIIGAIDENDQFCSFSNYGDNVEYALPGANIYSTFKNNQYISLSGTSMAAPFMTGILLAGDYNEDGTVYMPKGSAKIPQID